MVSASLRTFILHVRFTEPERAALVSASHAAGQTVSDWVRGAVAREMQIEREGMGSR